VYRVGIDRLHVFLRPPPDFLNGINREKRDDACAAVVGVVAAVVAVAAGGGACFLNGII